MNGEAAHTSQKQVLVISLKSERQIKGAVAEAVVVDRSCGL